MTGLVARWLGVLAGALVALATHFGVHLDSGTALVVLTAALGELGHLVVKLAARRWPAVGRVLAWIARERAELRPLTGTAPAPGQPAVVDPRRSGGGNVTLVVPATTGAQVIQTDGMPDGYVPPSASLTPPQDGTSTGTQ